MIREAHRLLKQYRRVDRTMWGHPNGSMTPLLNEIGPEVKRIASSNEIHKLFLMYFSGMLPYSKLSYQCIWMPMLTPSFHRVL